MDVTQRQLARYFGVSPRTIWQLRHDGVIRRHRNRKYSLERAIRATLAYYKERALTAEQVCRAFCPEELEAYREGYRISDDYDIWT